MSQSGRLPILKTRLNELLGEKSITEFAKELGLSRQTVGFYLNGDRIPDSETLIQICRSCHVSADWLLGLSNEQMPDSTVQGACKYTGLSSSTINLLHYQPDKSIRSFYRKLFDGIVQAGEDGLESSPELIHRAAEAHVIAKRKSLDFRQDIENSVNSLSIDADGTYKISAKEAESIFLMEAQAEISKCLANVLGDMEYDVIKAIEAAGTIAKGDFEWIVVDEEVEDHDPWVSARKEAE